MRNTLGLDDDLEGFELAQDLQASFGFKFANGEAEACRTVGDIFSVMATRYSAISVRNQGCASAMAFYRLRRALKDAGYSLLLTPESRLDEIPSQSPKALFQEIRTHSGLRLPGLKPSGVWIAGCFVILMSIAAPFALEVANTQHFRFMLLTFGISTIGAILMRVDHGKLPDGCQTLGDLARKAAGLNFGQLVTLGAGPRQKDLWAALVEVLTEHSLIKREEINMETLLLQKQLRDG